MSWSPTPTTPERQYRTAWFPTPPASKPREYQPAWFPRYRLKPSDTGIGIDQAAALPRIPATDTGVGADRALAPRITELLADAAAGRDTALLKPKLYVADNGLGADLARPGVRPSDAGRGADLCQVRPRYAAIDRAVGADMLTIPRISTTARDTGLGADLAVGGFTAITVVTGNWAVAGTYTFTIPVGCRYIDVVLVGAGGGGASSGTFYTNGGYPGAPGVWATITLERGVHIPWTAISLTIIVGTGGARGSGGFTGTAGSAGSATTLSLSGTELLSATGGAGGIADLTGTGTQTGLGPGNKTYNGQTYPGGANQTTAGAAGNAAGGGGAGGKNFGRAGGVGAPGGAWYRAYQ